MDDADGVRRGECVGDLAPECEHLIDRQRAAGDVVVECRAVKQLHDDEIAARMLADVVHRAHVWMVQPRCCAGLTTEAFNRLAVVREFL